MEKTIQIKIVCDETTCHSKDFYTFGTDLKKIRCQFLGSKKFGSIPVCMLFPSNDDSSTELNEKDGWIQRCDECMTASRV
jgi:hypothetical protein